MGFFVNRFPYTDFNKINLDWIMRTLKSLTARVNALDPGNVTGIVAVENGGTGADNAADARTNLGIGSITYPVDSVNGQTGTVVLTASDVGALPDNYTPPAAPVDSVNGKTGTVVLDYSDVGALPDTYTPPAAPVDSVNGKTGTVVLSYSDVGALPDTYTPPAAPVSSVNGLTGAVTLSAANVGALGVWRGENATTGGTVYDLTISSYTDFMMVCCSAATADNNGIYYVDTSNNRVRLIGNAANGLTITITSGVVTITTTSGSCKVYFMPLPALT